MPMLPGLDTPGYLSLIMGPMYSGKTSYLLDLYKKYRLCNISTIAINYYGDTRYTDDCKISTHDLKTIPCVHSKENLHDLDMQEIEKHKVILINEGQFFKDIVEWVKILVEEKKKIVFICGLDGDYKREKFGNWLDLIPLSDELVKLSALCMTCKNQSAQFTHRITNETDQKVIGSDAYIPCCRKCYIDNITNKK